MRRFSMKRIIWKIRTHTGFRKKKTPVIHDYFNKAEKDMRVGMAPFSIRGVSGILNFTSHAGTEPEESRDQLENTTVIAPASKQCYKFS